MIRLLLSLKPFLIHVIVSVRLGLAKINSLLPTILPIFGVSFGDDDAKLINGFVDASIQLVGAALAIYGRWVVKESVSVKP